MTTWATLDDLRALIDRYRDDKAVSDARVQVMNERIKALECEIKQLKDFISEQFVHITCTAKNKSPVEMKLLRSLTEEEGRKIIVEKFFGIRVKKPMSEVVLRCENSFIDFQDLCDGDCIYVGVRKTFY